MGVKIIESIPQTHSSKYDMLILDMWEIINNRIECCELTDFPYSDKTGIGEINNNAKCVFARAFREATSKRIDINKIPFRIIREKQKDGTCKYYAYFATSTWDMLIEKARNGENV